MAKKKGRKPPQELLELFEELTLRDNSFMTLFFTDNLEATELVLNIILDRNDLHVMKVEVQKTMKSPMKGGRDIILDVYAEDSEGKHYDIEIQNDSSGASPQRARMHSCRLDSRMLKSREDFKEMKESFVIFITEKDVIGKGYPVYHVDRCIKELGNMDFKDGNHIIYVNGSFLDETTPVGRLMKDFGCSKSADMFYDVLKKGMSHFKDTEEGVIKVCDKLEMYANKREEEGEARGEARGRAEGEAKGEATAKRENAKRMIASGKLTLEDVSLFSDLPFSEVIELANRKTD